MERTMAFDSRRRLAEITFPTLVIAGADDRAVPLHHAQMLHEGIRASELVVIPGTGHTLIWTHSAEFVRVTEGFLEAAA
jgi:pimeloyl-ACP methyl ester carboxylesterase